MTGNKFDGSPYTQLTTPARGDVQGVIKDISETLPENQTKYAALEDLLKFGSWSSKVRSVTASGTVTLANTDPLFVEIDPNGSNRDVSFPAKSDDNHGYYVRHSGSANTLTLKRSGGATITTLAAGEVKYIMPSTLNDFSAQTGGSGGTPTITSITPTTTDITATLVTGGVSIHKADISGLTANRNFILPAGAAGDRVKLVIGTGDDTYAFIIKGAASITINGGSAATEWSRVFITNEIVEFVATSTTNWQVELNGRIPCYAAMSDVNPQNIANITFTKVTFDTADANIGQLVDLTNDKITIRRAGSYEIVAQVYYYNFAAGSLQCSTYKNGSATGMPAAEDSTYGMATNSYGNPKVIGTKTLAVADYIELYGRQNSGSAQNPGMKPGTPAILIVKEILS